MRVGIARFIYTRCSHASRIIIHRRRENNCVRVDFVISGRHLNLIFFCNKKTKSWELVDFSVELRVLAAEVLNKLNRNEKGMLNHEQKRPYCGRKQYY
jgi:hypothetical protein